MATTVIDARLAEDPRDVIHRAVAALSSGKIVALPTETVYGLAASALNAKTVDRLFEVKGRDTNDPFALAIKGSEDALDYVPNMSVVARRLARRCWPGPVTLVMDGDHPESVVSRLPSGVQHAVNPRGAIGLRVTANPLTMSTLRLLAGPLVLTSANKSGDKEIVEAGSIADEMGDAVDLVIDDGKSRYGQSSTVVRVHGSEYSILRNGVVSNEVLKQLSGFMALVVCTGNTCRSPMAEALLKKRFAEKLNCTIEELAEKGVSIASAGIAAMPGGKPSAESVEVMNELGIDITQHSSQPVTDRLAKQADVILTMTEGHRFALTSHWPDVSTRTHLLRKDGQDVTDPIGYSASVYKNCAEQIDENVRKWVDEIGMPETGNQK